MVTSGQRAFNISTKSITAKLITFESSRWAAPMSRFDRKLRPLPRNLILLKGLKQDKLKSPSLSEQLFFKYYLLQY